MDHRKPPKPKGWFAPPGICRLCCKITVKKRRWHDACRIIWRIASNPQFARIMVFARDRGICARCGTFADQWHVDHEGPLVDAFGDFSYWELDNLVTLCVEHHQAKTGREKKRLAKEKRQRYKFAGLGGLAKPTPTPRPRQRRFQLPF